MPTSVVPSSTAGTSTSTSAPHSTPPAGSGSGLEDWQVILIAIGGLVVLVVLALISWVVIKKVIKARHYAPPFGEAKYDHFN